MSTDDLRKGLDMLDRELVLFGQQLCTFGQQNFAVRLNPIRERYRILRAEVESRLAEAETVCVGAGPAVVLPPSEPQPRKGKGR